MRNRWLLAVLITLFGVAGHAQSDGRRASVAGGADEYLGTWAGTWASTDGARAGQFEMTIEKDGNGNPAGKVKVTGGESDHSADFKSLSFDGNKMTGKYDYPLDPADEVALDATVDGKTATGTWLVHPRGQDADVLARGTWTVTKK
jgi:hypothetical protein